VALSSKLSSIIDIVYWAVLSISVLGAARMTHGVAWADSAASCSFEVMIPVPGLPARLPLGCEMQKRPAEG